MSLTSEIIQELTDKAGMDFTGGVYLSNSDPDAVIQEYVDRGIIQKTDATAGNLLIAFIEYVINYNGQDYDVPLPIMSILDNNK